MTAWLDDPRLWIPLGGLVAHAAITWWMVRSHEAKIQLLESDMDSLREWRAEMLGEARARAELRDAEKP